MSDDDDVIMRYICGEATLGEYIGWSGLDSRLWHQCEGDESLLERYRHTLVKALEELDALPRSNDFWKGTNQRATLTKLPDFAALCRRTNLDDPFAIESEIALTLYGACGPIRVEHWLELTRLNALDLEWMTWATWIHWRDWGEECLSGYVDAAFGIGCVDEATGCLARVAASHHWEAHNFADEVQSMLLFC
jgi:hypothetical protein